MRHKIFELFPCRGFQGGISETPPVSFHFELVDQVEPSQDADQIAPENVHDQMVPPALLEVV